jgi:hypothetical protein
LPQQILKGSLATSYQSQSQSQTSSYANDDWQRKPASNQAE